MECVSKYKIRAVCPHGVHVEHYDDRSGKDGIFGKSWEHLTCKKCFQEHPDHKVEIDGKTYEVMD